MNESYIIQDRLLYKNEELFVDKQKAIDYFVNHYLIRDMEHICKEFIQKHPNDWQELVKANPQIVEQEVPNFYYRYALFCVYRIL